MENKNYYPLRVGKYASYIVSDMPVLHRNKKEMDSEWEHYGGFVIAESIPSEIAKELVEVFNQKYAPKEDNSGHSFTEGMEMDSISNDKSVFEPNKPTIDDQIAFIRQQKATSMFLAISENLKAIKRWNETPVYHGKIDVERVIEDLVHALKTHAFYGETRDNAIQNAEAALGMLQAFKEEREAGMAPREAPDWVTLRFQEKPLNPAEVIELNYIPMPERAELVHEIAEMIPENPAIKFSGSIAFNVKIANAIITAIEAMDHKKRKHGIQVQPKPKNT